MSFELSPESPDSPEILSYELRMEIIRRIHDGVQKVKDLDQRYESFQRKNGVPMIDRYLINSPSNNEVLMPHYRIKLGPKSRTQVLDGVASVRLRVPIMQNSADENAGEYLANDIFITNIMEGGNAARYLLTPRGFKPYAHPDEIVVDPDGAMFGNVLMVQNTAEDTPVEPDAGEEPVNNSPRILLSELEMLQREKEIIWQYQPVVQDNLPTQDAM